MIWESDSHDLLAPMALDKIDLLAALVKRHDVFHALSLARADG